MLCVDLLVRLNDDMLSARCGGQPWEVNRVGFKREAVKAHLARGYARISEKKHDEIREQAKEKYPSPYLW